MAVDDRGHRTILRNLKFDDGWHLLVPNITRLWLDLLPGEQYPAPETVAAFGALRELVLDVTGPQYGGGELHLDRWPIVHSPRLQVVRLISERPRLALPAGTVLAYVRRCLGSGPRLAALVVDGLELSTEPGVNLAEVVDDVAESVSIVRSEKAWRESYSAWVNSWTDLWSF